MATTTLSQFLGINNLLPSEDLFAIERGSAKTYMPEAVNVDVSESFGLSRRRGFSAIDSGEFHSLWSSPSGAHTFVVKDSVLHRINNDLTLSSLATPIGNRRTSYAEISQGDVHFSNGDSHWVYSAGVVTQLAQGGTYDFTDQYLDQAEDASYYDAFPAVNELEWAFGRLWGADNVAIWYSPPYHPRRCRLDTDFIAFKEPTMLKAVSDGLFVGNSDGAWFFSGANPKGMKASQISGSGVVAGTPITVQAEKFKMDGAFGAAVVWESTQGKMLGLAGGRLLPLTEANVSYGVGESGASMLREWQGLTQHVSTFSTPSGDSSNMRTTDIAIAEVRRNGIII